MLYDKIITITTRFIVISECIDKSLLAYGVPLFLPLYVLSRCLFPSSILHCQLYNKAQNLKYQKQYRYSGYFQFERFPKRELSCPIKEIRSHDKTYTFKGLEVIDGKVTIYSLSLQILCNRFPLRAILMYNGEFMPFVILQQ